MHREVANNVTALWSGVLHASALKSDLRKFLYIKKFGTAQVIVPFLDLRIDAADVDLRDDRGILRTLAVDIDLPAKSCKFSVSRTEELMNAETNR